MYIYIYIKTIHIYTKDYQKILKAKKNKMSNHEYEPEKDENIRF